MINIFRKHQQFLMILVTIMVIIAFVWLYNTTQLDRIGRDRVATAYGKGITQAEFERGAREFSLALNLGLFELVEGLAGLNQREAAQNFVLNSIVLKHEATQLEIQPADQEVVEAMKAIPVFQTNGAFDPKKYGMLVQDQLAPKGFTEKQLEDLIRADLSLKKIKALLDSTIEPSVAEFRTAYLQRFQKMELALVRLKLADFEKGVQVTDEDLQKAFEQRKANLRSEEKRKVSYVYFGLTAEQEKLTGKERVEQLQKLADKAQALSQAMLEKDAKFAETASKLGVEAKTTGEFPRSKPDPGLIEAPAAVTAAFSLRSEDPNSDVIQAKSGFYVLHLEGITESKPLSFEEAKPTLLTQLKSERAQEQLSLKGNEIRSKIEEQLKAGKNFVDAAAAVGLKAETFPAASLAEPPEDTPALSDGSILGQAAELREGELSGLIPADEEGLIVFVQKRLPIDEAKFAKDKELMMPSFNRSRLATVVREWLRNRRAGANIQIIGG